ncbi:MAG: heat shock protein HspQ [Pseudomonadales bacterium]|nr:heat shock protein HspQ [Pseudomonadales bacterium]NRA15078.1 heat shock protein HspQ [Oceanospirillaceae bacterium]
MGTVTDISRAKFSVGELILHQLFNYRGVIVDVDRKFCATDAWYENMAKSRPPKNKPWYHVLVHDSNITTYVAEQNLKSDTSPTPINHPLLQSYFSKLEDGCYVRNEPIN